MKQDNSKIIKEIDYLRSALVLKIPFIVSLLRRARIVLTDDLPAAAAVDSEFNMYINRKIWEKSNTQERAFFLLHETLHLALGHVKYDPRKIRHTLMNIAVDCVVNHLLTDIATPPDVNKYVYPSNIESQINEYIKGINKMCSQLSPGFKPIPKLQFPDVEKIKKMSHLEIYSILCKIPQPLIKVSGSMPGGMSETKYPGDGDIIIEGVGYGGCGGDKENKLSGDILGGKGPGGDEIQSGDGSIYQGKNNEEKGAEWAKAFIRAVMSTKLAGNAPAGLLEALSELLKAQVPWNSYLRQLIINGIGKTIISSWALPSRKSTEFPGIKYFTRPKIHVKIDTSGSIDRDTLKQFLGEVFSLAHYSNLNINFWDADVYEDINVKNPSDVINRAMKLIRGGGGTCIKPALERTLKDFRRGDIMVVFTDGYLFDLDKCGRELTKITNMSSSFIWVYTGQENKLSPRIRQVKVIPNI